MLALVREHDADQMLLEHDAEERRRRGVTFRELATEYLRWLEEITGAKPSTLRAYRLLLCEPGTAYRRGSGVSHGVVMAALGDRPAHGMTTREVEDLLRSIASTGVAPRTVNKTRQLVCAIFTYGMRPSTYGLAVKPARCADPEWSRSAVRLPSTSPSRSRSWSGRSRLVVTATRHDRPLATRRSQRAPARMSKIPSWCAWPHTPASVAAS
ncbi:MAG: hypothetical protein ACR2IP_04310 [Solirubrobacteraceae bacterium]